MKKNTYSKIIVIIIILLNVIFTFGTLFVFLKTGNEPVVLISAWFSFTTVELWTLAKIKREKEKVQNGKDN